jgi:hypothetical protein
MVLVYLFGLPGACFTMIVQIDNQTSLFSGKNFFTFTIVVARILRSEDSITFDVLPSRSTASHGRCKCSGFAKANGTT